MTGISAVGQTCRSMPADLWICLRSLGSHVTLMWLFRRVGWRRVTQVDQAPHTQGFLGTSGKALTGSHKSIKPANRWRWQTSQASRQKNSVQQVHCHGQRTRRVAGCSPPVVLWQALTSQALLDRTAAATDASPSCRTLLSAAMDAPRHRLNPAARLYQVRHL